MNKSINHKPNTECIDSGATSNMKQNLSNFEPKRYVYCNNTVVSIGERAEVRIDSYGISCSKLDGKILRQEHKLHVLTLDCDLFSSTCLGQKGKRIFTTLRRRDDAFIDS